MNDAYARPDDDRLRLAFDLLEETGVVVLDRVGAVVEWNFAATRVLGYPKAEVLGRRFAEFDRVPDVKQPSLEHCLHLAATEGRAQTERSFTRRDGARFVALLRIAALREAAAPESASQGFVVELRDVTLKRRREAELRLVAESSLTAIVAVDARGQITTVNRQMEKLFGYDREQLVGQSIERIVPERYRGGHGRSVAGFFANPETRPMGMGRDLFGLRSDGVEFPIEIGLRPIDDGLQTLVVASIVDITARKEAERQARQHLNDLAHVARLSSIGQMFSELAHEINQPLAAAANYARACVAFAKTEGGASREQINDWMTKTAEQTARAIEIVKRLGRFVKKDGGARTVLDLNPVVEQVTTVSLSTLRSAFSDGRTMDVELKLDPNLPPIEADRVQIEQVLLNLIRNAAEAMQEGETPEPKVTLSTTHDDHWVCVSVTDNGPGIQPAEQGRLFEPYFSTKPSGMGLGLSISRSIVEDHRGKLEVESSPAGTTFRFRLPTTGRNETNRN